MASCEDKIKKNLGLSRCGMPGMPKGMITVPKGTAISQTNFVSKTWWNSKLLAVYSLRAFLWPWFRTIENLGAQPVYEDTPLSKMKVMKGKLGWRFGIKESMCLHTAMFTHNSAGSDVDVIIIDNENNFIATLDEEGMVRGFSIDLLNLEDIVFSDGSVSSKSPLFLALADSDELNANGVMFKANFINQLYRVVDVKLEVIGNPTTGSVQIQVSAVCDGTPISGLVKDDFVFKKTSDGSAVVISTAPESSSTPGLYTLTQAGALFVDGTVDFVSAATLSISGYESTGPATVNEP